MENHAIFVIGMEMGEGEVMNDDLFALIGFAFSIFLIGAVFVKTFTNSSNIEDLKIEIKILKERCVR